MGIRLSSGSRPQSPKGLPLHILNRFSVAEQVTGPVQIICRDHRMTPYAALYVELALRSGYPLATLDQPQKDAAKALGIHCL